MSNYSQATPYFERAIALLEAAKPEQTLALAFALGGLADSQLAAGNVQSAEKNYTRSLRMLDGNPNASAREVGVMNANLASILAGDGRSEAAVPLYQQSIVSLSEAYGGRHAVLAEVYYKLGVAFDAAGLPTEAEASFEQSLAIARTTKKNPQQMARTLDAMALQLLERREFARAETLLREAVTLRELEGAGDPGELGASLRYLGATFQAQNAFPAAEAQYVRADPLLSAALGADDSDYGFFLRDLAQVYAAQNKLHQAEDAYGRSLSILEAGLGVQDPTVIRTRQSYEQVIRAQATP
jgi:Tfp pilus assembly protein PilF